MGDNQTLPLDLRRTDLWKDVPPDEMWTRYQADLRRQIDDLYRPGRVREIVKVRDSGPAEPQVV